MNDANIVELYWNRNEDAIKETSKKYGNYCYSISYNILGRNEDAEESVNDTYLVAWDSMPPHKPKNLATFLGKITRRISIDKWRHKNAKKRGNGQIDEALEELSECISDSNSVEKTIEAELLNKTINKFVRALPEAEQTVFIRRYWYLDSVKDICRLCGYSKTKVQSMLFRTRKKLRETLDKEEVI